MKDYKQEVSKGCERCIWNNSCIGSKLLEYAPYIKIFQSHILSVNDHVFNTGDTLSTLYVIKSGAIKIYVTNHSGDEQILNFSLPNDVIGLDGYDSDQYVSSAIALQTSSVCAIPLVEVKKILNEVVPEWLLKLALDNFKRHGRNISLLNKKKAKSRMAAFLIDTADNCKSLGCSGKNFELSMSRDDIGNYLGLASETVSRTLTQLQQEGWVKMERRQVTIVDIPHLSEAAQHR